MGITDLLKNYKIRNCELQTTQVRGVSSCKNVGTVHITATRAILIVVHCAPCSLARQYNHNHRYNNKDRTIESNR